MLYCVCDDETSCNARDGLHVMVQRESPLEKKKNRRLSLLLLVSGSSLWVLYFFVYFLIRSRDRIFAFLFAYASVVSTCVARGAPSHSYEDSAARDPSYPSTEGDTKVL